MRRHLLTGVLKCGRDGCDGYMSARRTIDKRITYTCKSCRGVSIRAVQVEPLIYVLVGGRLAKPDAVDLLKAKQHDEAEAEAIRTELQTWYGELVKIGEERGQLLLTGQQAKIATDVVEEKIAVLVRGQQDQERLRVFDGIPLGRPEAVDAVLELSPHRLRAVLAVLGPVTVAPVGKGNGRVFDPDRVQVGW